MRLKYRQFLSYVLLLACTSISLLGEGLHLLVPFAAHHHHHHHGRCIVTYARHGTKHDDSHLVAIDHTRRYSEHTQLGTASSVAVLTANGHDADSHLCGICSFLFQIISQPVEVVAPHECEPLVDVTPNLRQLNCATTSLGLPAPRGPPLLA
jgi:hypothetical protein